MPKTRQVVELRKMPTLDLIKLGEEKRAELFALKFQAVLGSLEQTHRIKLIKKEIARVELVLTEKKRAGENTNQVVKADYSKAVDAADKAGKKVRKKQIEEMKKAYGVDEHGHDHESEIEKAMANSVENVLNEAETIASEPKKAPAKKPAAKTAAKPATKKVAEKPAEKKPAAKTKTSGEAKPKTTTTKTTKPSNKKEGAK